MRDRLINLGNMGPPGTPQSVRNNAPSRRKLSTRRTGRGRGVLGNRRRTKDKRSNDRRSATPDDERSHCLPGDTHIVQQRP